jgi:hypothetical protein
VLTLFASELGLIHILKLLNDGGTVAPSAGMEEQTGHRCLQERTAGDDTARGQPETVQTNHHLVCLAEAQTACAGSSLGKQKSSTSSC